MKKTDGTNRVGVVVTDNPSSLIPLPSWTIPTLDNCHRHLQQLILLEMSKVGIVQSVTYLGSCPWAESLQKFSPLVVKWCCPIVQRIAVKLQQADLVPSFSTTFYHHMVKTSVPWNTTPTFMLF